MRKKIIGITTDVLFYIAGCFLYSTAVTMFISSNEISPGGLTGIATALNFLFALPSGIMLLILNIPILIIGFIKFGGAFIFKTAFVTFFLSVSLTITDTVLPQFHIDKVLAAVFGGILMGVGLSLVMLRGATTGGVDILAKLVNRRFRHITVGKLILLMDAFVISIATIAYRNIESALYSVIAMYATSRVMDAVLYGSDKGKMIYIVTEFPKEICKDINSDLRRGVTVLSAKGGYTGITRSLLLCTVRRYEVSAVYSIIDKYDRNAFIVVSDAGEIIGEGFKALK
ncbi:MAG: YitT family protein [Clostridia bacterium]|nr:YitT family protein [Clostridia bacterium]